MKIQTNLFNDQTEDKKDQKKKSGKKKVESKAAYRRKLGLVLIVSLLLPAVFYLSARASRWWQEITGPQVYEYGEVNVMER